MAEITGDKLDNSLVGTSGDDVITGLAGEDTLIGGGGSDKLVGNNGDDVLRGGDGDDLAKGGRGHDLLFGDAGADTLMGGEGDDQLTGGAGADVFLFKAPDVDGSDDDINDFAQGVDKIHVSDLDVTQVSSQLHGVAGELSLQANTIVGISVLQYDADGDGVSDLTIRVLGLVGTGDLIV